MAKPPRVKSRSVTAAKRSSSTPPWALIAAVVAVVVFAAVIAIAVSTSGGGDGTYAADIDVDGSLPLTPESGSDPAIGSTAPKLAGVDWDGAAVSAPVDGEPTALVFLAHWCGFCQEELPRLVDYAAANPLPEGTNIVAVNTLASPGRPNFGPQEWFEREQWPFPVIVDDTTTSAWTAYGGTGTPFTVIVDADGNVTQRIVGGVDPAVLWATLADLAD